MSSLGTSKGVLEIAKFAVYVTVPIGLMYFFASNTKNLQKVMGNVSFNIVRSENLYFVFFQLCVGLYLISSFCCIYFS